MTRKEENQSYDQKKGSADSRVTGQKQGLPGHNIADGESADLGRGQSTAEKPASATIPQQQGCGPSVTDYPGLPSERPRR